MVATGQNSPFSATPLNMRVRDWLERFAACVRERDIASARSMFDANVASFGSWTGRMLGLDELVARQWMNVWPKTCGFVFDLDHAFGGIDADGAWAAVTWKSNAVEADGAAGFERVGRSTFVFKVVGGELIAVHTHFSMNPAGRL